MRLIRGLLQGGPSHLRSIDWLLVLAAIVLLTLGLASIYSVELSYQTGSFLNIKKQIAAVVIAVVVGVVVTLSNYKLLRNYSLVLYLVGVVLLVSLLIFGSSIRGATGWFSIGQISFQPVEFMKVALVVSLATYFSQRARRLFGLREFIESGWIAAVPVVLTVMQPDMGSAFILFGTWFILILFAGIRMRYVLLFLVVGALLGVLAWNFVLYEYQQARILTFLDPGFDPLGQGYNVTQAIIAIGAGGLFGRGLGFGTQSQLKFLPESQTDFIFAVIAEELGFFGVLLVLSAFVLLFYRLFAQTKIARDNFTTYLILGVASVFFLQVFVNVGMNLVMFPVTGVGLLGSIFFINHSICHPKKDQIYGMRVCGWYLIVRFVRRATTQWKRAC